MALRLRRALCVRSAVAFRARNHVLQVPRLNSYPTAAALRSSVACGRSYSHSSRQPSAPTPTMVAFADGACRGNPGHGACGALVIDPETQRVVASRARYLSGHETNNTAEYNGLLLALELAEELELTSLQICMDSELVVKQMRGQYRVKAPHLRELYQQSRARCRFLQSVEFRHVPREENALADRLANEALDEEASASELSTCEQVVVER